MLKGFNFMITLEAAVCVAVEPYCIILTGKLHNSWQVDEITWLLSPLGISRHKKKKQARSSVFPPVSCYMLQRSGTNDFKRLKVKGAPCSFGEDILIRWQNLCFHDWINKLTSGLTFFTVSLCWYVADPATFLVSNSVLGIFFSLWEQLVYSVMEKESPSLYYCEY